MRGTRASNDCLEDTVDIVKDVIVPKSQNKIAACFEIGGAGRVLCGAFSMLPAVKLDD